MSDVDSQDKDAKIYASIKQSLGQVMPAMKIVEWGLSIAMILSIATDFSKDQQNGVGAIGPLSATSLYLFFIVAIFSITQRQTRINRALVREIERFKQQVETK